MNKRIKCKKTKLKNLKNLKRQKEILGCIAEVFTIEKERFADGYFIFSWEPNSVCYFTLKETPDWKYGIWLDEYSYDIFGEHVELIDKFKPSRTYIAHENVEAFIEEVKDIQLRPKFHFVNSLTYGDVEEMPQGKQEEFVEQEYNNYIQKRQKEEEEKEADKKMIFDLFKNKLLKLNKVVAVGVQDKNRYGMICTPRYELSIVVEKETSDEEVDKLFTSCEALIYRVNSEQQTFEHSACLKGIFDDLKDINKDHYKYFN